VCLAARREALYGRESWMVVVLLLIVVELGCLGLWVATGAGVPLLAALAAGLAIVYLARFSGR
jgi:hypothetical protein